MAALSGLDASSISSHSIRHGSATFLQQAGWDLEEIKKRGNWKSSAVKRYLHPTVADKLKRDETVSTFLSFFS